MQINGNKIGKCLKRCTCLFSIDQRNSTPEEAHRLLILLFPTLEPNNVRLLRICFRNVDYLPLRHVVCLYIISCSIRNKHIMYLRVLYVFLNNFNTLTFVTDHAMLCLNPSRYPWVPRCSRIHCQRLRLFRSKPVSFTVADYIMFVFFFRHPA